jgi:hypothetical protein
MRRPRAPSLQGLRALQCAPLIRAPWEDRWIGGGCVHSRGCVQKLLDDGYLRHDIERDRSGRTLVRTDEGQAQLA